MASKLIQMDPLAIEADMTPADYKAFQRHVLLRYYKLPWMVAFCVLLTGSLNSWGGKDDPVGQKIIYALILFVFFCGVGFVGAAFMKLMLKLGGGLFAAAMGRHTFEVTESGIIETHDYGRTELKVCGIRAVDETKAHFFVISKAGVGIIIPKRSVGVPAVLYHLRDRVLSSSK